MQLRARDLIVLRLTKSELSTLTVLYAICYPFFTNNRFQMEKLLGLPN